MTRRVPNRRRRRPKGPKTIRKRPCPGCSQMKCDNTKVPYVDYKELDTLGRFISERGKIRSRRVTGACAQYQRRVAIAIKNAREMALLPYTKSPR
ncbi:MAG: 30S ribosomal protein S18 [Acidimicrobiia bacterium]|nr:30S ribosomal protein S18 [bacterium]MXX64625.1 30S ribosomal protein S18 [Acidimicrobiia bacterium]MCY3579108.1 30S ribosomal protein S18 [bacterium]MCY3653192.1 30S ribosomal protein S18 [bacterium]MDE0642648.1 30S ribosomal protein S18 [bacterium]